MAFVYTAKKIALPKLYISQNHNEKKNSRVKPKTAFIFIKHFSLMSEQIAYAEHNSVVFRLSNFFLFSKIIAFSRTLMIICFKEKDFNFKDFLNLRLFFKVKGIS